MLNCSLESFFFQGVVKPDIVFFGENLPKRFYSYIVDFPKCDLLVIMGTSLEVRVTLNQSSSFANLLVEKF